MQAGRAQRQVLERLAQALSPREYSLHLRGGPEGDELVVCHRKRGVLALTILTGDIELDPRTHQWWRVSSDGERPIRDPMRQAQATAWRLGEELRRERVLSPPPLHATPPVVGHALVLPDLPRRPLPGSWPEALVIDRDRLDRPRAAMEAAFAFLQRRTPLFVPAAPGAWRRLNALLSPEGARALDPGAVLARAEPTWVDLGDYQLRALEMMTVLDRVAVRGAGGTGKTLVAVAATRSLTEDGERVLLTCHNRLVGDLLAASLEDLPGALALSFHQLCRLLLVENGVEPPAPRAGQDPAQFWREYLPRLAFECMGAYERRFDTVVVDEAHRFEAGWWPLLERLLRSGGRMLALYDPNLDAQASARSATGDWPEVVLAVNRRSTAALNRAALRAGGERLAGEDGPVPGERPEVRGYCSCLGLIRQLADELVRVTRKEAVPTGSVVILSPRPVSSSCLADVDTLGDFALVARRTTRVDEIRFSTVSAFAGLDAEVVLLVDLDPEQGVGLGRDLYLALTRARRRVVIWVREQHVEQMRALLRPGGTGAG